MAALYLTHGLKPLTHVAAIGTFTSLALTVALSAIVTRLADLSGVVSEEAIFILVLETVDLARAARPGGTRGDGMWCACRRQFGWRDPRDG